MLMCSERPNWSNRQAAGGEESLEIGLFSPARAQKASAQSWTVGMLLSLSLVSSALSSHVGEAMRETGGLRTPGPSQNMPVEMTMSGPAACPRPAGSCSPGILTWGLRYTSSDHAAT